MIPEFAILGHPNEGKSSVLSTLSEDDSVRISPQPGETSKCRTFPVRIDGREIIKFTDTPGFQNPRKVLNILQGYDNEVADKFLVFVEENQEDPKFQHDCELLRPLVAGAGIIYIADGSRPLRKVDLAEMEILRLTGKPRMAILNCKSEEDDHLKKWKEECRKHFNSIRLFNAHNATYNERIKLLEALKSIEQDWHEPLSFVVDSFKKDWAARNKKSAEMLTDFLTEAISHSRKTNLKKGTGQDEEKLFELYKNDLKKLEKHCHQQIRKLFKHNIFDYELPPQSILHQDLFSEQTAKLLGLDKKQLIIAGGAGGAALAATIDLAAGGASLGFFTTLGGILGATGALYGSKNIAAKLKRFGLDTDTETFQIGPNENPQFPFILLDRSLIYYSHIINWAHGRRDYDSKKDPSHSVSFTHTLPVSSVKTMGKFFRLQHKQEQQSDILREEVLQIILDCMNSISKVSGK